MTQRHSDVVLIGSGIMSATLGVMLKELDPSLTVHIYERLDGVALESSDAWNNAGTGHAALCELNYTPEGKDGTVDIEKALRIDEQFEQSKQFWSFLVEAGYVREPSQFIHAVPHMSFVRGDVDVDFLKRRYRALSAHHLFGDMRFTEDAKTIAEWAPLLIRGRKQKEHLAATRSDLGTDVNFGALTRLLFARLQTLPGVTISLGHEVTEVERLPSSGEWRVTLDGITHDTPFVFIGAGGAALPLLATSQIPEVEGYGGFPVGGQWLRCDKPDIIAQHHAKVYGRAEKGSPPMSVPHLDARVIDGKPALLFGPFACITTKFLKHGSWMDLAASLGAGNVVPMLQAGWDNLELTKYLIEQAGLLPEERLAALRKFMPSARLDDWELVWAGQRVQIIKKKGDRGTLEFGTEVVSAADGSLAAVLGASPGASTAVTIMLDLVHRCMRDRATSEHWRRAVERMVPTYGHSLRDDEALTQKLRARSDRCLRLR